MAFKVTDSEAYLIGGIALLVFLAFLMGNAGEIVLVLGVVGVTILGLIWWQKRQAKERDLKGERQLDL